MTESSEQLPKKDEYRIRALAIKGAIDKTERPYLDLAKGRSDKASQKYRSNYRQKLERSLKGEAYVDLTDGDMEDARLKLERLKHSPGKNVAIKLVNRVALLGVDLMAKKVQQAETPARQQNFTPLKK